MKIEFKKVKGKMVKIPELYGEKYFPVYTGDIFELENGKKIMFIDDEPMEVKISRVEKSITMKKFFANIPDAFRAKRFIGNIMEIM